MSADFFEAVGEPRPRGIVVEIEKLLAERPWLTSTEIAKAIDRKPDYVASVACKLVREKRLLREWKLSRHGGSLFAMNDPGLAEKNARILRERINENDARMAEKMAAVLPKAFAKAGAVKGTADA